MDAKEEHVKKSKKSKISAKDRAQIEAEAVERERDRLREEMRRERLTPLQRFIEDHGQCERTETDRYVFEDGALLESGGFMLAPPANEREKLRLILLFHTIRYEKAKEEFEQRKENMAAFASNALNAPDAVPHVGSVEKAKRELQELREKAIPLRKAWQKAKREYEGCIPERVKLARARDAQNREQARELLNTLNDIQL